jgi:hypothetical protein
LAANISSEWLAWASSSSRKEAATYRILTTTGRALVAFATTRTTEVETTSTQKCVEDQSVRCALPRVVGAATIDILVDEVAGEIPDVVFP